MKLLSLPIKVYLIFQLTWCSSKGSEAKRVDRYPLQNKSYTPNNILDRECECGRRNPQSRIIGGEEAKRHEFPWRCFLTIGCSCTLISRNWVLTAAHCLKDISSVTVVLGLHDLTEEEQLTEVRTSRVIYIHQRYNHTTLENDIAVLRLDHSVKFNRQISPICLPFKYAWKDFVRERVITSGWGVTQMNPTNSTQLARLLQKVELRVTTSEACALFWGSSLPIEDLICAIGKDGGGICSGDSGGSLDLLRNGRYYAIGVTSGTTKGCVRTEPDVFVRLTEYLKWIEVTTTEKFCKM